MAVDVASLMFSPSPGPPIAAIRRLFVAPSDEAYPEVELLLEQAAITGVVAATAVAVARNFKNSLRCIFLVLSPRSLIS